MNDIYMEDKSGDVTRLDAKALAKQFNFRLMNGYDYQGQAVYQVNGAAPTVCIKNINAQIGYGLFAGEDIYPGDSLGIYAGSLIESAQRIDTNYTMQTGCSQFLIDASQCGNHTRFIQHGLTRNELERYYGIEQVEKSGVKAANLKIDASQTYQFHQQNLHVPQLIAIRKIKKGEQLLYSYGANYWKDRGLCFFNADDQVFTPALHAQTITFSLLTDDNRRISIEEDFETIKKACLHPVVLLDFAGKYYAVDSRMISRRIVQAAFHIQIEPSMCLSVETLYSLGLRTLEAGQKSGKSRQEKHHHAALALHYFNVLAVLPSDYSQAELRLHMQASLSVLNQVR